MEHPRERPGSDVVLNYASPSTTTIRIGEILALPGFLSGILICIPFLTGALAVAIAIVLLRDWEAVRNRDRALVITGLVFGAANLVLWTGVLLRGN